MNNERGKKEQPGQEAQSPQTYPTNRRQPGPEAIGYQKRKDKRGTAARRQAKRNLAGQGAYQ